MRSIAFRSENSWGNDLDRSHTFTKHEPANVETEHALRAKGDAFGNTTTNMKHRATLTSAVNTGEC